MEMFSLKEPFTWEYFCAIFSAFLSMFNSDIWKKTEDNMSKCTNLFLQKEKMK